MFALKNNPYNVGNPSSRKNYVGKRISSRQLRIEKAEFPNPRHFRSMHLFKRNGQSTCRRRSAITPEHNFWGGQELSGIQSRHNFFTIQLQFQSSHEQNYGSLSTCPNSAIFARLPSTPARFAPTRRPSCRRHWDTCQGEPGQQS